MEDFVHKPVLLKEVEEILDPRSGKIFIDGTCGLGGHTEMLAKAGAREIALDRDKKALEISQKRLKRYQDIIFIQANFADIDLVLRRLKIKEVDGILLDLGVSSMQLEDEDRGFSFQKDSMLDMRMDQGQDLNAQKVVNGYPEGKLLRLFRDYGEEKFAQKIAQNIVRKRPVSTVKKLIEIIEKSIPSRERLKRKKHFATNIFRALRMEVNAEIENLTNFLGKSLQCLKPSGRIVIITFHSIEDRITKRGFRMLRSKGEGKILTKKPITPAIEEIEANPRARSAKLRAFEKSK